MQVLKLQQEEIGAWAGEVGTGIDDDQKAADIQRLVEDFTHETNEADHNGLTPLHWVAALPIDSAPLRLAARRCSGGPKGTTSDTPSASRCRGGCTGRVGV